MRFQTVFLLAAVMASALVAGLGQAHAQLLPGLQTDGLVTTPAVPAPKKSQPAVKPSEPAKPSPPPEQPPQARPAETGATQTPATPPVQGAPQTADPGTSSHNGTAAPSGAGEKTGSGETSGSGDTTDSAGKADTDEKPKPIAEPASDLVLEANGDLEGLNKELEALQKKVANAGEKDNLLSKLRLEVTKLQGKAEDLTTELGPRLSDIEKQIQKLGPEPAKGDPPETQATADLRTELNGKRAQVAGAIKKSELIGVKARQLASRIQSNRQKIFADQILKRTASPFAPDLWRDVVSEVPSATRQLATIFGHLIERVQTVLPAFLILVLGAVIIYFALRIALRRSLRSSLQRHEDGDDPTFFTRATFSGWVAIALLTPPAVAAMVLFVGMDQLQVLYGELGRIFEVSLPAFLAYLGVSALGYAILQPKRPRWRLFDLASPTARRLLWIVKGIAAVYALDLVFQELIRAVYLPLPVRIAEAAVANFAFAGLLLALVWTPFNGQPREASDGTGPQQPQPAAGALYPKALKIPVLVVGLLIAGASAIGYVSLGGFVAGQVVVAGGIVVGALLLHLAIRALTAASKEGRAAPLQTSLQRGMGLEPQYANIIGQIISVALHVVLALVAIPLLFLSWGYSIADTVVWLKSLLFGFEIGQFRISLVQIFLAIGLFVLVLFLTKLVQKSINARLMKPGRIDSGVANSVYTFVGYIGIAIATLIAVSYAGLDVTNLAIVAGALSVGIGFGLQSIVNNFVSGLIMLIERPIKVGDWIVVAGHEGIVRKISVRSTELETFNRASVIVPNSDFMTSTVTNWTHQNATGRIDIPVGVSYSADPDQVIELLTEVAGQSQAVLREPPPRTVFVDFGASSLDFLVQVYVADIGHRLVVASDLRRNIFAALKVAGIEIPFPQHDLHIRDLDPVRAALTRMARDRIGPDGDGVEFETPGPGQPGKGDAP